MHSGRNPLLEGVSLTARAERSTSSTPTFFFQLPDLLAHGRLGHMEALGGTAVV